MQEDRYSQGSNYSWAVFLILVGGLLLLNSIRVVDWGVWVYIIRFWPLLVVLIGVRIVLGSSNIARFIGMVLTIVLTLGAFVVGYIQYTQEPISFLPSKVNDWVLKGGSGVFNLNKELVEKFDEVNSQTYPNISQRVIRVDAGASNLTFSEGETDQYFVVKSKYPKGYKEPILNHTKSLDVLDIDFTGAKSQNFELYYTNSEYEITIGKLDMETDIDLKLGAGSGEVILEDAQIKDFWMEVGAGKLDLKLGVNSIPKGETKLTVGAGKMNLGLPTRVGYTLEYDLGIGKITVNGDSVTEITGGRGSYTSENFASSDIQLTLFVTVGVGSFNIANI